MRKVRENLLVTSGDLAPYAQGSAVFNSTTGAINVSPGQIVFYDEATGLALDQTDIAGVPTVVVAVALDTTGDGFADTLRKASGERIYAPQIRSARSKTATGGVPGIVDFMFECVQCDEAYSFSVTWEDDKTQNVYPYNRPGSETITATSGCCSGCENCDTTAACADMADQIVGYVNGTLYGANVGFDRKSAAAAAAARPYTAQRLFANTATACIEITNGVVSVSGTADKITTITTGDGAIDVSACSPGATTPAAALPCIIDAINAGLTTGSAILTGAPGGGYSILITTDAAVVNPNGITYTTAGLTDFCVTDTPLADAAMDCGVRFASKDIVLDCDCYPPNPPVSYKARNLNVSMGQDWKCGSAVVTQVQKTAEPENLGYDWLWREYVSDNGGMGRKHRPYNSMSGPLNLPLKGDRSKAAMNSGIDCESTYCSISFEHNIPYKDTGIHGNMVAPKGRTVILIPSADTTTSAAVVTILQAWRAEYFADQPAISCT